MFRQIFLIDIFLLLVCCQLCGQTCVAQAVQTSDNSDGNTFSKFFEAGGDPINIDYKSTGDKESTDCKVTVEKIESVFLVATDSLMVALADVTFHKEEKKIDILARFVETENKDWSETKLKESGKNWKTQFVRKDSENEKN